VRQARASDGPHLRFAELQVPHRIVRRGHAARRHDLDLCRPFAQFVARRAAAFGNPVGDAGEAGPGFAAGAADDRRLMRSRAQIPMPAGLAQRVTGGEDPRPVHQALFDRLGEPEIRATGVADRRKAALQHRFEHARRLQCNEARRQLGEPRENLVDRDDMDVRVDQPRHQRAAVEIH
jgi:hypothetical protein